MSDGTSVRSPAMSLAHEMGHVAQDLDGKLAGKIRRIPIENANLKKYETPIAEQLGESTRSSYDSHNGNCGRANSIHFTTTHSSRTWRWFKKYTIQHNQWPIVGLFKEELGMYAKKQSMIGLIILLLLAVIILISYGRSNMFSKKPFFNFSELIENDNVDDISLTIYYMSPYIFTDFPQSVDDLINRCGDNKIVISGSELEEYSDLFQQVSNDDLIRFKKKSSYVDARLYYVLESKKNGKVFDVTMWGIDGDDESILVNGFEVKENDVFYDMVIPFLPEETTKEYENYRVGIWPK